MKLKEIVLKESPASLAHESSIAKALEYRGAVIWAEPKGSDAGWPDVGATFMLPSGNLHVHAEVKMNKTDPMGSLRKWTFDGNQFTAPGPLTDDQIMILEIMNANESVKDRASLFLTLLQKYFDPSITNISSGSLSVIPDKQERYNRAVKFVEQAKKEFGGTGQNFQLSTPRIEDPRIGAGTLNHYKRKFKPKGDGENLMMFVLGNEMLLVEPITVEPSVYKDFLATMQVPSIEKMPTSFNGTLEVRAQLRGFSGQGTKPVRIDVMASLRAPGLKKISGTPIR